MALTVESGIGVPTADSYVTRAEFIAYVLNYYGETVADTDASDTSIRRAFSYINGLKWKGSQTYGRGLQSGAWPRSEVSDCNGDLVADSEIPSEIKQAQYELARAELQSPGVLSPSGSIRDTLITKEKVDVIEVNYDTSKIIPGDDVGRVIVEAAMRYIRCFLVSGGKSRHVPYAVSI